MVKPVKRRTLKNGDETYTIRVANGRARNGKTNYEKKDIRVSKDLSDTKKRKLLEDETFKLEEEIKRGMNTTSIIFFEKYSKDWLFLKEQSTLSPSTKYGYGITVKKLNAEFGKYKVKEITPMIIKNKKEFANVVNNLKFTYAKTYTNSAPHEYAMAEEDTKELEVIRALNRYIQEQYDEIETFWNKEYKVLFVESHKYWQVGDWTITKFLNRNWDFKNDDNTTNISITESYRGS